MKKIITALGNKILNQNLKKEEEFEILSEDIQYQEGILEFLEQEPNVEMIILSELLPGNFEIKELIEKIKQYNKNIQIILFLEKKKEELENYLYAKGIYSIFYNNQIETEEIIEFIKNNQKNSNNEIRRELNELKKMLLEKENLQSFKNFSHNKTITQENRKKQNKIICINGISGVGKSMITINLAKTLKSNFEKILILDFDISNNSLHTILGMKKYPKKIKDKIKNGNLLNEISIEELIMKINSKMDLIAGINLLFDEKYKISSEKIKNILEILKQKYDVIIIDTAAHYFFEYTKEIMKYCNLNIFITEANISEIKKAKKLLNIYINKWKIPLNNFHILFNKYNKNAIDLTILKHIFSEFSILGKLSSSSKYNSIINQNAKYQLDKKIQKEYEQISQEILKNNLLIKERKQ